MFIYFFFFLQVMAVFWNSSETDRKCKQLCTIQNSTTTILQRTTSILQFKYYQVCANYGPKKTSSKLDTSLFAQVLSSFSRNKRSFIIVGRCKIYRLKIIIFIHIFFRKWSSSSSSSSFMSSAIFTRRWVASRNFSFRVLHVALKFFMNYVFR